MTNSENKACDTCTHWVRETIKIGYNGKVAKCDIFDGDPFVYPEKWTCGQWEERTWKKLS